MFAKQKQILTIEASGSACREAGRQAKQGLFAFIQARITKTRGERDREMLCSSRNHENEQQPRPQIEVNKSKLSLKRIG